MDERPLPRRRLLGSLGAASVGSIAGCVGGVPDSEDPHYVGPDGSDGNPGTETEPLATIEAALTAAAPGETVRLLPGTYTQAVNVTEDQAGEPDAPITLTGPPEATLKPPDTEGPIIAIRTSHFHLTGLTVDGLVDPDNPDDHESYNESQLIYIDPDDGLLGHDPEEPTYIEDLVISPHRIGNSQSAFINAALLKDAAIGGFEVIGPAGTYWLLRNEIGEPIPDDFSTGHNGEFVYLGTAPDNLDDNKGIEVYDRTRNIRVHHIDNSAGYGHSQLVDCKPGTENVTVEYCTDAWGSRQAYEADRTATLRSQGYNNTFRWNVIRGTRGDVVEITRTFRGPDGGNVNDRGPETPLEAQFGTETEVYGNVFTEYTFKAVAFPQTHRLDPQLDRSSPDHQGPICANRIDGPTDGAPESSCQTELPQRSGIGHLGGESPWHADGEPNGFEAIRAEMGAPAMEVTPSMQTASIDINTPLSVSVEVTNTGDVRGRKRLRCAVAGVLADQTQVTLDPGEETTVTLEAQPVFGWTIPDGVDGDTVPVTVNETTVDTVTVASGWLIEPSIREERITVGDTVRIDVPISHTGTTEGDIYLPVYDAAYYGDSPFVTGLTTVGPDEEWTNTMERDVQFPGKIPLELFGRLFGAVVVEEPA